MPANWKTAFDAALRERHPASRAKLCEAARRAIADRIIELAGEPQDANTAAEREELDAATRTLTLYELS